ncbi:ribonuclease H family protein, partial [Klebsiella pneumoniae]|uniref:ribonuclease H family protein n=1 Tax=Klebsiella pneumoniae TaxID=573 RepID=UPI0013A67DC0
MRKLQGRVQSITRFISHLADISQPFTKTLHKGVTFAWNEECEKKFEHIKQYLSNPPILMPPIQGKPLILYVSATDTSLGALLAQHDENKKERAIYYISRTLVAYEKN